MLQLILYSAGFVMLSGLMAAIEAAFLSVTPGEVEEGVARRDFGSRALRAITQRSTQSIVVLVIFTNTINVLGPIVAGQKAISLFGDMAIGGITAVLTLATIIFSEIIPKSIGLHYAPGISRKAAPFIQAFLFLLYPLVIGLERLSDMFKTGERPVGTETQIRTLVKLGRRAGYIERDEGQLIRRAFVLNDRTAADVMTPLKDVVGIKESSTIRQAATQVFRHAFSRYPLFRKQPNDVSGVVMSRDILTALIESKGDDPVSSIRRPCLRVSAGDRSDELLVKFRDARIHLGVVEQQGATIGVVTLEDVLEELVGEIEDEKDAPPP